MKVYLLWLHDCVLDVFSNEQDAIDTAVALTRRPEYRDVRWVRRGTRWTTDSKTWRSGLPVISRLEVEEREVRQ